MMKKFLAITCIAAICYSCGNNSSTTSTPAADTKPAAEDISKNPDYQKGLELISKSNCLTCHKVDETSTGPAYRDVANKYAGKADAVDTLAAKVIKGGSGNWGQVPMLAHPELTTDDAKQMVKYILLLKNK